MALGLSTRKALSILKEQLEAVLDGHLKERKKCGFPPVRSKDDGIHTRPRASWIIPKAIQ